MNKLKSFLLAFFWLCVIGGAFGYLFYLIFTASILTILTAAFKVIVCILILYAVLSFASLIYQMIDHERK